MLLPNSLANTLEDKIYLILILQLLQQKEIAGVVNQLQTSKTKNGYIKLIAPVDEQIKVAKKPEVKTAAPKKVITIAKKKKAPAEGGC